MTPTAIRRRLLPAAVATATGALTVGAAVVVPAAAQAASRFHTSLSIRSVHQAVQSGGRDTITGVLLAHGHALPSRTVTLQDKAAGSDTWANEDAASTNRHGRVGFVIHPTQTARYRLVYAGSEVFAPSRSGVVSVTVKPPRPATTLTIAVAQATIDAGQSDTVTGKLTDANGQPLSGDTVALRHRPAGAKQSHRLATSTTASDGTVSFTVTPKVTNVYRLVFGGTSDEAPSISQPARVVVRGGSSLSIDVRAKGDGSLLISGVLRGSGRPLAGRPVTLQSAASPSGTFSDVATKQTGKHGYVAFAQPAPTAETCYRLTFAGGPDRNGTTTGTWCYAGPSAG